jgi:hypothetical protein
MTDPDDDFTPKPTLVRIAVGLWVLVAVEVVGVIVAWFVLPAGNLAFATLPCVLLLGLAVVLEGLRAWRQRASVGSAASHSLLCGVLILIPVVIRMRAGMAGWNWEAGLIAAGIGGQLLVAGVLALVGAKSYQAWKTRQDGDDFDDYTAGRRERSRD